MKPCLPKLAFKLLLVAVPFLLTTKIYSQHFMFGEKTKFEAGLNFGPTFFLGDLGGNSGKGSTFVKDVNLELTKFMKGAFITVYPTGWLGLRLAAQYTYVKGEDYIINTNGVHELWRKQRNLDFRSEMIEAYAAVEILPTMLFAKYDDYEPFIRPYGFVGVGVFHFNPEGSIEGPNGVRTWHKLHPLRTEGEGMEEYPDKKPYKLTQINIPMGGGIKVMVSDRISTSMELLYRKTFTDYIDDVSTTYIDPDKFDKYLTPADAIIARKIHDKTHGIVTPGVNRYAPGTQRGNSKNMDAYFSTLIKVGIKLGQVGTAEQRRQANQTKCPKFY